MANIFFDPFDAGPTADMPQAGSRTTDARQSPVQASEIRELRDQVERLALMCQAMWELVRARASLSDAELEKLAQEIDLRDGMADGKLTSHPVKCPNCGRVSNSRHKKCLYCGLLFEGDAFA